MGPLWERGEVDFCWFGLTVGSGGAEACGIWEWRDGGLWDFGVGGEDWYILPIAMVDMRAGE